MTRVTNDAGEPTVTLVERRVALSNRVWHVYFDHVQGAGLEIDNYITVAPKNERQDLLSGVAVVPVIDGDIVLLYNYRHPVDRFLWELPRGFIDAGEEPAAAAARELEEETGLLCEPAHLVSLGVSIPEPSTIRGRGALFLAEHCRYGGTQLTDEISLGAATRIPRAQVFAMLDRHEIEDSTTCIALHRYRTLLIGG